MKNIWIKLNLFKDNTENIGHNNILNKYQGPGIRELCHNSKIFIV